MVVGSIPSSTPPIMFNTWFQTGCYYNAREKSIRCFWPTIWTIYPLLYLYNQPLAIYLNCFSIISTGHYLSFCLLTTFHTLSISTCNVQVLQLTQFLFFFLLIRWATVFPCIPWGTNKPGCQSLSYGRNVLVGLSKSFGWWVVVSVAFYLL